MKNNYVLKIYLTICLAIISFFSNAQCEGVGFYNSDQKQTTVTINRCEFTSVIIPLQIPFAHPKVQISSNSNSLSEDVKVIYANKYININANFNQNPEFLNPEFKILVSDSLDPSLTCSLDLKVQSIPCVLPIKNVESILADCDSLHGALIIQRFSQCKVVVKNMSQIEVYSKEYKDFTLADTIFDLPVGAYSIEAYVYNSTAYLIPVQSMYEIISLPKKIGISTPYNKNIICEGVPILLIAPKAQKYSWSTGDTTQIISVNKPGKISVFFTNTLEKNCLQNDTIDLILNPKLTLDVIQERKDCKTDTVTIHYKAKGGTTPYTFLDYPKNTCIDGNCLTVQDSITKHTFAYAGYTALLTDAKGCSVENNYFIFPSSTYLSITSLFPKTFCQGDSTQLYVPDAEGKKYVWYVDGNEVLNVDTNVLTVKSSGKYSVSIIDNGCEIHSDTVLVSVLSVDPIPIYSNASIICAGIPVVYSTEQNKKEYTWKFPNQIINVDYSIINGGTDSSNTVTIQWHTTGIKQVVLSFSNGLCNNIASYVTTEVIETRYLVAVSPIKSNTCINSENIYKVKIMNPINSLGIQTPLFWNIPGIAGTDYMILAGGGGFDTSITVQWLKPKKYVINVSNLINCAGNLIQFEVDVFDTIAPKNIFANATDNICTMDSLKLAINSLSDCTIQWYQDGKQIANAVDSIYFAKTSGEYYAVIMNEGKCSFQTPKFVYSKDNCAWIVKNSAEEIKIYPNPASTLIHIDFDAYAENKMQWLSLTGSVLYEQTLLLDKNLVEVPDLPNGIYFIQVNDANNQIIKREKITIQN